MTMEFLSIRKKIAIILGSILVCLVISELLLRLAGVAYFLSLKNNPEYTQIKNDDIYKILCFGASYTLGFGVPKDQNYPKYLQRILNFHYPDRKFMVINGGKGYANSSYFLNNLEAYVQKYKPNLIILNIGTNEYQLQYSNIIRANRGYIPFLEKISLNIRIFLHKFRTYKLFKLIFIKMKSEVEKKVNWINEKKDPVRRYIRLGKEYEAKGMYKMAVQNFKKAVEIEPHNGAGYASLGIHYMRRNYWELTKANFEEAIRKDNHCIEAYYGLSRFYAEKEKDYKSAISILMEGLDNNPNSLDAHLFLIEYCLKVMNYDLAIDDLKKALRIYPNNQRLHWRLSELYTLTGDKESANRQKLKALRAKNTKANLRILDDPESIDRLFEYNLSHIVTILNKENIKICLVNAGSKFEQQSGIRKVASDLNIPLADLYTYFNNLPNKQLLWNSLFDHPNQKGYQAMAEVIYRVLADYNLLG